MNKRTLLIATTNAGKAREIAQALSSQPFDIISLKDLSDIPPEPEETEATIEGNALLKAKYYAEKTGLLSLADDSGLFIDALDGWPGVKAARVADTDDTRCEIVLEKMNGNENRSAQFRGVLALVDPDEGTTFIAHGAIDLEIQQEMPSSRNHGHGYDPILFAPVVGKTLDDITSKEKNAISHRGKALAKVKYHLQNNFSTRHIVVPFSLIIDDGKVLMILRNDPHRPEYHLKWEFPGGTVERGEQMHENVIRETAEEAGYEVEVVKLLQYISAELQSYPTFEYQIYLVPYVCRIVKKLESVDNEEEVADIKWFDLDDVLNHELIGENERMYRKLLPELKEVIAENNL